MILLAILTAFFIPAWCGLAFGGRRGAIIVAALLVFTCLVALGAIGSDAIELARHSAGFAFFLGTVGLGVGTVLRSED